MGQTVDNGSINNINAAQTGTYGYGLGFDAMDSSDRDVNKTDTYNDKYSEIVGYKYNREASIDTRANSIMDNFEEYLNDMNEKAKEAGEDEESREKKANEAAKEIARSLTSEEIKQLGMMGIDVESAALSDLMGMVVTMRGNAHKEEMQKIMAQISVDNGDMDNLVVAGGRVMAANTNIEIDNVDVSDILAQETKQDSAVSDEKVEASANMVKPDFEVGNSELVYLIRNNMSVSKENLYKAHYSGVKINSSSADDSMFNDMRSQIDRVIEQAGYEADETSIEGARILMDNKLPITSDTIRAYMEFQGYVGKNVNELEFSEQYPNADIAKADKLYEDVKSISPHTVYEMVAEGKSVTIAAALKYTEKKGYGNKYSGYEEKGNNLHALTAMRRMEEIRLAMTHEAAGRLVKMDINIDTRELSGVVFALKNMEQTMISDSLRNAGVDPSDENIGIYRELETKVSELAVAPAEILVSPLKGYSFTINALYEQKDSTDESYRSFESVRRSYEAVGTAPRHDMGDSITKAFSNVDDILNEMGLDVNYENQRAIRILGYNSIEITQENINDIINYDRQVNDLIDTFYPEAVLGMIKDGINPLDVPIDELNRTIRERNYNEGVTETENFAAYLRDMENGGELTAEERESYIGVYRVMNKLAKSGDREAGWIFANSSRLTVRNLISAMRSRKSSGIDINVDEGFGMLESVSENGKRIDEQISSAFNEFTASNQEVEEYMAQNAIESSIINYAAVNRMVNSSGGIYQVVSDILSKMKFSTKTGDNMVDEETGNISDSLSGKDIPSPLSFAPDRILESLAGSGEMSLKYQDLRNQLTELMYSAGEAGTLTGMDISAIKTVNAGFNILSRMARDDRYQVPVETSQGVKVMNLIVKHEEEGRGTIELRIKGDIMGEVNAVIRSNEEGSLSGYMVSSVSEGNYELMSSRDSFENSLSDSGFLGEDILLGSVGTDRMESKLGGTADATDLYKASVALVKAIGGIIC